MKNRNIAVISQIHMRSFHHVIKLLFFYLLSILNSGAVKITIIMSKPIGYAFTPVSYYAF